MPLSEHEQRLLEQMERALYQEDPKFASSLRDGGPRRGNRKHIVLGVVLVLAGLGALIGGVATTIVAIGILGFVLMLAGAYLVIRALRAPAPDQAAAGAPEAAPRPAPKAGFMDNLEERFKRRRDEQDGS
jgi:hypothetical protein